jgi:tetratricopeptide (TPR) repeat protein
VLNAADAAFALGKTDEAAGLYERVINTPPTEPPPAAVAITDYAHFRAMVALLALGREDEAQAHEEALRSREPSAPLPRLADQFWNQYTMTASAKAACNQLQPQIATQAAPVLQTLQSLGVTADPARLCSVT